MFYSLALLALCWLWHREKCSACYRQTKRDIRAETEATRELVRILEQRRARRAAKGVKKR